MSTSFFHLESIEQSIFLREFPLKFHQIGTTVQEGVAIELACLFVPSLVGCFLRCWNILSCISSYSNTDLPKLDHLQNDLAEETKLAGRWNNLEVAMT